MKYVYANEAGILPGEEITQKLNSLLSELAGDDGEKTLVFEKGEYVIDSAYAPEPELYITNTMGDGEWLKGERQHLNRVGMYFKGIKSLTVEGNSSVFAVRGSLTNIAVCDCENLYLKNFTLVTENPDMHAFKVVRKSAFRVDFELDCESRYEFKKGKYFFVGKDYERAFTAGRLTARWIGRVPASNGRSVVRTSHPLAGAVSIKKTGERAFRAVYLIRPRCEEGDEFYIFDVRRKYQGVFASRAKNLRLDGITQRFNYGLACVFQDCENVAVTDCVFAPPANGAKKLASVADFMQVCCCRGTVEVRRNAFCGAGDDCINVHGIHFAVKKRDGDGWLLAFMHPQTHGFCPFGTGDVVRFVSPETLLPVTEGVVESAELKDEHTVKLSLKEPARTDLKGLMAENASACPDLIFEGNVIDRIITRGALVTTSGKVIIENNDFYNTSMHAVLVSDDAKSWYESGFVRDVTIRDNRFYGNKGYYVCVKPENRVYKGAVHSGITIEDNLFSSPFSEGFYFKAASNITLKNNEFVFGERIRAVDALAETEK